MTQLTAFLLTLALEAPAGLVAVRVARSSRSALWGALAAVLGSCATHPFVWWLNEEWARGSGWVMRIAVLEVGAALVEALFYARLCRLTSLRAIAVSLAVNAFSFALGLVWDLCSRG